MTEYGRGPGSQPWHPEDPLYGDQAWDGGRAAARQQGGGDPYAEQPADPYADPYGTGQPQYQQPQAQPQAGPPQYQQGYPQQYRQEYHPQQYPQQQDPYATGGWEPAPPPGHGYGDAAGPYGTPPAGPYGTGPQQDRPGPYATGPAYPPPGAQHAHGGPPGGGGHPEQGHGPGGPGGGPGPGGHGRPPGPPPGPDPDTGWDPGPDQGESAFFSSPDEEEDGPDEPSSSRNGRRGDRNRRGDTKRRSGCACLAVTLVLGGGLATAGYFGYEFYDSRFGPAPDYSGQGHGEVQVEIPAGSSHSDMGNILKEAGVVKSHDAFVAATKDNDKALGIHAGVYTLHREMSAGAAIEMMLDPASQGGLIVPEGKRASQIYELIDEKLEEKKGTTKKAAQSADLGLPSWAEDDPEGFLFPAKYAAGKETRPEDVLKAMVKRAKAEYRKMDLAGEAEKVGQSPREVIIVASLVQAEAQEDGDFGKVSRVIHNRLDQGMKLQFDSTINYAKGESKLNTSVADTRFKSPYNTYLHEDLPPGPIDNPGLKAIDAALEPTQGDWLYFVSVKPGDTRFTESHAEHEKNVADFNEYSRKKRENGG